MIEIVSPDLAWLSRVSHADEVLSGPVELPPFVGAPDGHKLVLDDGHTPYALAVGRTVAIAHRGGLPRVVSAAAPVEALDWAVRTFFVQRPPAHGMHVMELDGLRRWVGDVPALRLVRCTNCGGTGREPDAPIFEEQLEPACTVCAGECYAVANRAAGYVQVNGVTVDRRDLVPIVKHLRGRVVGLFTAPSTDGLGLGRDVHVREVMPCGPRAAKDGAWRIVLSAVDDAEKVAA